MCLAMRRLMCALMFACALSCVSIYDMSYVCHPHLHVHGNVISLKSIRKPLVWDQANILPHSKPNSIFFYYLLFYYLFLLPNSDYLCFCSQSGSAQLMRWKTSHFPSIQVLCHCFQLPCLQQGNCTQSCSGFCAPTA